MRKNKIFIALLPIVTMIAFPSCNKQCVITLKSGAGIFATGTTEMSLTVRPGTKLSQLALEQPVSFFYDAGKMEDFMYPVGWADAKGEIYQDYVFNGNTTLEARYFPSQELVINAVENKLNYALQDLLARVSDQTYQSQAIVIYQNIVAGLRACTSEVQTTSFLVGGQSDIGMLMRVMLTPGKESQISVLQQCRDIFIPLCLQINSQMSIVVGKSFAALFDAMGEGYDASQTEHVEWFNHFIEKLRNTLLNAPIYTFQGVGIFEQAAITATKRIMVSVIPKPEALAPMNRLYDLYHASFFECRTNMQAAAIGKMGAAISDASGENYPKGYDTYYEISKKEINEILHWGA